MKYIKEGALFIFGAVAFIATVATVFIALGIISKLCFLLFKIGWKLF
jgi:hypothetical protein